MEDHKINVQKFCVAENVNDAEKIAKEFSKSHISILCHACFCFFHEDFLNMDISLTIPCRASNLKHAYMRYRWREHF